MDRVLTPQIAGWLRRQARCPEASGLVLRGSLVLSALCPGGRTPVDVDYLVPGPFDARAAEKLACAMAAARPPDEPPIYLARTLVIYGETRFPGLRVFAGPEPLQIDFGFGDPLAAPPMPVSLAGVTLPACTAETLFAWKVHGLCEHGRGQWRAKDLYDLWWMWTQLGGRLDRAQLREAVRLAFDSRQTPLASLDDFRERPSWGESRGGVRKWRVLKKPHTLEFLEARKIVRESVAVILG